MLWTQSESPRIWRHGKSNFETDEVLHAEETYTNDVLKRIAEEGFNGIWFFCSLRGLMDSRIFPELNGANVAERLASLQTVIDRARQYGIDVWLYFNAPGGLKADHPFWQEHPEVKGALLERWDKYALCSSMPEVQSFLVDAIESTFAQLKGVKGVILITAGEDVTHCWSKWDVMRGDEKPDCPRCRDREPADIVREQLQAWVDVSRRQENPFRVLAWNWEWAYWYPDPQTPVIDALPDGVELMLDFEFGGTRLWRDRRIPIGEYSISYAGPGERFVACRELAKKHSIPTYAKIEVDVAHELASIPNLPLLPNIHAKLKVMTELDIAGFMGCWATGSEFTLNTCAVKLFLKDPERFLDADVFLDQLAREYFGLQETDRIRNCWQQFSKAFLEYPYSTSMVYGGPQNDAPARPLSLHYEGKPAGSSSMAGPMGDDLGGCFGPFQRTENPFTPGEIIDGFSQLSTLWNAALPDYEAALNIGTSPSKEQQRHRTEELSCARMIGYQMKSTVNVLKFYLALRRQMENLSLKAPCDVPPTPELLSLMREELANVEEALPLVERDSRLGFHQSYQGYKYNAALIRKKIASMRNELSAVDAAAV